MSFNSKLRDELLAGELFSTLHEAKVLIEAAFLTRLSPTAASALPYATVRPAQTPAWAIRQHLRLTLPLGIETSA